MVIFEVTLAIWLLGKGFDPAVYDGVRVTHADMTTAG